MFSSTKVSKPSILFFPILLLLFGCKSSQKEAPITKNGQDKSLDINCLPRLIDNPEYEKELIKIYEDGGDTIIYSRNELDKIEKLFPVLVESIPRPPVDAYFLSGIWKQYISQSGDTTTISFGSEAGQDNFYLLYAYYLRRQNGVEAYHFQRDTLLKLFHTINGIYEGLNYGGTFFGHQYKRIPAFVEYSISSYRTNHEYFDKKYNIHPQKVLYLQSLKQYLDDEESVSSYNLTKDKTYSERKLQFEKKLKLIDSLTRSYFCLNQAQDFEIQNYK